MEHIPKNSILNFEPIHTYTTKKLAHPKTQIISYNLSMTNINIVTLINYHKILSY
jgi:hypothetical protein